MNALISFLTGPLNRAVWLCWFLPCSVAGGILLTLRTGGVQFRRFGAALRLALRGAGRRARPDAGSVTPNQALSTSLAATVGTGNIVGAGQAVAMGGPGALFWLWLAAIGGMAVKYCEIALSLRYRERNAQGEWVGGPMYYLRGGLGRRGSGLARAYALLGAAASLGVGNISQVNSITGAVIGAANSFGPGLPVAAERVLRCGLGLLLAVLAALVLFGGMGRVGRVTERLVPFMCGLYLLLTLSVILSHAGRLGPVLREVFASALRPRAAGGAAAGIALRQTVLWGLRRGAFSNEAGLGSAAIAHAAAEERDPARQGLFGVFEVFADTLILCTLTALSILVSGVPVSYGRLPGPELVRDAFATLLGTRAAAVFVAGALALFAFSTVLGCALYGGRCVEFLFGPRAAEPYRMLWILVIVPGCLLPIETVWDLADTCNALMSIPNLIALFALSGEAGRLGRSAPAR